MNLKKNLKKKQKKKPIAMSNCRPPCLLEREEKNIIFLLGEWVRLEVMERTGSSGRFEGEKSGKDEKRERNG